MRTVRIPRGPGCIGAPRTGDRQPATPRSRAMTEHSLDSLDFDRTLMHDVLGDLAEERARRIVCEGYSAAIWWYVRELARSTPHVAGDVVRRALRTQRGRVVVLAIAALVSVVCVAIAVAFTIRAVPARLGLGQNDTVVVNNEWPARIPVQLLDERGRTLDEDASGARFRSFAGNGISVSRTGEVTCRRSGTARVVVTRGALSRAFVLQCAPLHSLWFRAAEQALVVGGPAEPFSFRGAAPDSSPVERLVGTVTVDDSDIVSVDGSFLRPHRAGTTMLRVIIGDKHDDIRLTVHEPAISPSQIAIDQVYSRDVSLAPGTELRWPIEHGLYTIWLRPPAGEQRPSLHLMLQNFNCAGMFSQERFCVALHGAVLRVIAPAGTGSNAPLVGRLFVTRHRN